MTLPKVYGAWILTFINFVRRTKVVKIIKGSKVAKTKMQSAQRTDSHPMPPRVTTRKHCQMWAAQLILKMSKLIDEK